jgi:hypothetical protein
VAVAVHSVMVTVTVLVVVSRRHNGQLSTRCGVSGEVSYHDVPGHGWLHQREQLHLLPRREDQQLKKTSGMAKRRILKKEAAYRYQRQGRL